MVEKFVGKEQELRIMRDQFNEFQGKEALLSEQRQLIDELRHELEASEREVTTIREEWKEFRSK